MSTQDTAIEYSKRRLALGLAEEGIKLGFLCGNVGALLTALVLGNIAGFLLLLALSMGAILVLIVIYGTAFGLMFGLPNALLTTAIVTRWHYPLRSERQLQLSVILSALVLDVAIDFGVNNVMRGADLPFLGTGWTSVITRFGLPAIIVSCIWANLRLCKWYSVRAPRG